MAPTSSYVCLWFSVFITSSWGAGAVALLIEVSLGLLVEGVSRQLTWKIHCRILMNRDYFLIPLREISLKSR